MKQKTIKLSKIKISQDMELYMPRPEKIASKYEYYRNKIRVNRKYNTNNNPFQSQIIVNSHNVLLDGYTSYLIAKMFGIKKVNIIIN